MRKAFWVDEAQSGEKFFEFQLAERLGMTVRELRARMTQYEFEEWKAYTRAVNRKYEQEAEAAT